MKVLYVSINNLKESIIASGLPKSAELEPDFNRELTEQDFKRAKILANAKQGSGHDCFIKGIGVFMVIKAKEKFWKQFDRYHFKDTVSSTSTMHMITSVDLESWLPNSISKETIKDLKNDIEWYKHYDSLGNKKITSELFEQITDKLPMGLYYTRAITLNYLQIKSMYFQRRNHKLKEWRELCKFFESLPYFKEWIIDVKDR